MPWTAQIGPVTSPTPWGGVKFQTKLLLRIEWNVQICWNNHVLQPPLPLPWSSISQTMFFPRNSMLADLNSNTMFANPHCLGGWVRDGGQFPKNYHRNGRLTNMKSLHISKFQLIFRGKHYFGSWCPPHEKEGENMTLLGRWGHHDIPSKVFLPLYHLPPPHGLKGGHDTSMHFWKLYSILTKNLLKFTPPWGVWALQPWPFHVTINITCNSG